MINVLPVQQQSSFRIAFGLLLGLLALELVAILFLCEGTFMFSLDDPYIHLALAENLIQGHYGVNLEEYSAPSSSIIWPILIAPLTVLPATAYGLLLLNALFAGFSLFYVAKSIQLIEQHRHSEFTHRQRVFLLGGFVIFANLIGLAYTGMEHSFQVMVSCVMAWGLIQFVLKGDVPKALWLAILIAPLIRYECASISGATLFVLFFAGQYQRSLLTGVGIVLLLAAFTGFLFSIGLGPLPDSVMAKSDVAASGLAKITGNIAHNLNKPKGLLMVLAAIACAAMVFIKQENKALRLLTLAPLLAVLVHLIGGRIGWLWRYEIYIWVYISIIGFTLFMLYKPVLRKAGQWACQTVIVLMLLDAFVEHGLALLATPGASSNIYLQQYQLHRFIQEQQPDAIAVNDLGWTSYQNDGYVLDLWGLGSSKAREMRKAGQGVAWMETLAEEASVEVVMIYQEEKWFPEVPASWIKVAEFGFDGREVVSWYDVSFFARSQEQAIKLRQQLQAFEAKLPERCYINFQ